MTIDRALFRQYVNENPAFCEQNSVQNQNPFDFFQPRHQQRRNPRDDLNSLANQIFDLIEKKHKEGACELKIKLRSSEESQEQVISSFLKKIYQVACEIQRASADGPSNKRPRIETTNDIFEQFFGRHPIGFNQAESAPSQWRVNWSDNLSLLKNPKPKPKIAEPQFPDKVSPADQVLNEQRKRQELTDVTFRIGDNDHQVHRIILANRSPYFNRMLLSGMMESQQPQPHQTFAIKEITAKCFDTFLNSIYTQQPPQKELSLDQLLELTNYAHLAEVESLFRWCKIELTKSMSTEAFYTIAMLAYKLEDKSLLEYCEYYYCQHEKALSESETDLSDLSQAGVVEFLEVGLKFSAQALINACVAHLKQDITKDKESFAKLCTAAISAKENVANKLKKICSDYVKAHRLDFEKPEMQANKDLYKRLMSGLD